MALDPLEKDRLRRKMATRMQGFLEGVTAATCVGIHYYLESQFCELCQATHSEEILVIKNRSGKKMKLALSCLKEMVRFRVVDVEDLTRWLAKLPDLKLEAERKREQEKLQREEERRRLEKKVIVRKRTTESVL